MNFDFSQINLLDGGFALILVLFVVRGLLRGMINEVAGLVGIFLGFFVAERYYPKALPHVQGFITETSWATIVAYLVVFAATLVVVAIIAIAIRKFMSLTFTAWLDHVGGGIVGGAKGLLICSLALALLEMFQPNSPFLKNSILAQHVSSITSIIREYLPKIL